MGARRLTFWITVAATGVVGQIVFQTIAQRVPQLGLAKLAAFAGGGAQSA